MNKTIYQELRLLKNSDEMSLIWENKDEEFIEFLKSRGYVFQTLELPLNITPPLEDLLKHDFVLRRKSGLKEDIMLFTYLD